ncbi:glycoside hydrolase family 13 protein [Caproiciproducens sp.]|uniref:glycoside hydrolase family 13 protein n=1 Tax=Caproiciproducens sp. TaxID=1954376 RepID=UPI002896EEC7|nr:alpha-glucosidase [Caproiciproducens sp.]
MGETWWKSAVVYQIYPRSFMDSNGDGIGDLQGIIQKLDYIKDLGADVIWLCPVYQSPNDDNGYDISDYRRIMNEFGTMQDFDELLKQAHGRNIRIIMDLVVNHTSDEHQWFAESRKSVSNNYRDYYIWREGKAENPPNNWGSCFGGPAWKYDDRTGMYFLHLFSEKQPDLNWNNPDVRESVYDIMTWWLNKGIDGFRMDVISFISKKSELPDGEIKEGNRFGDFSPHVINGPLVHEYLQEMNKKVLSKYNIMTVGETPDVTIPEAKKYAGFGTGELNMVFQFEHMGLDSGKHGKWSENKFQLSDLKRVMSKWQTELYGCAWNSLYWSNHDQPRAVSRFGNDSNPIFWEKSAKMLATCLHMMQGTPFIYQGEELGMTNVTFENLKDYRDLETRNIFEELVHKQGMDAATVMKYLQHSSRDNARTPMQWDDSPNAGFASAVPWISVNPNYLRINAKAEVKDQNSIYNYYKKLIQLRKEYPVIIDGKYELIDESNKNVFAYTRTSDSQKLLVLCNFSEYPAEILLPADLESEYKDILISNYNNVHIRNKMQLRPYEAVACMD